MVLMFTWGIKVFSSAQDGMLIEQQSIRSLDLSELDLEATKEEQDNEDDEEEDVEEEDEDEEDGEKESRSALRRRMMVDENPYNRFLDIMEIF